MSAPNSLKDGDLRTERTWRALGEVADNPVVAAWREQARNTRLPNRLPWALAATLVLMLAGGVGYRLLYQGATSVQLAEQIQPSVTIANGEFKTVATERGKRRTVMLADGSRMTLNTSSRAQVDYRGPERHVQLLQGEALFDVAKDPQRPFVVTAAGRQVLALGTAFGVRLDGAAVQVTLVEGRIAVDEVELKPGQQLLAEARHTPVVRSVDTLRATSWQNGWVAFNRDTVRDAIQEVSRYTDDQIICDDPRLMDLHVSGTFRTGEVESFLNALAAIHPLTVERSRASELRLVARD